MENKRDWKQKLKLPKNIPKNILKKDRLVILLLLGVLLVVIAIPVPKEKKNEEDAGSINLESTTASSVSGNSYTKYMEAHLEEALSKVSGVGEVKVMITLKASSEKVIEKDQESSSETVKEEDSQGGSRSTASRTENETTVLAGDGEGAQGGDHPYVTKELSPVIEGVVVIASGGDHAVVVQNITEAVQALFDIDTHKIKVMKLNQN